MCRQRRRSWPSTAAGSARDPKRGFLAEAPNGHHLTFITSQRVGDESCSLIIYQGDETWQSGRIDELAQAYDDRLAPAVTLDLESPQPVFLSDWPDIDHGLVSLDRLPRS